MKKYLSVLKESRLFSGVTWEEIGSMLSCLGAHVHSFQKGEAVVRQGECAVELAVVVRGSLLIQTDDYWGNRSIINRIGAGELFGEAYVSPDCGPFPNDVVAAEEGELICFDPRRILTTCSSACRFHAMVIQNLFFAISEKNRNLVRKLLYTSRRSTRAKLIAYLSDEAKRCQSSAFSIPFNRQELADYLFVDRSAMSSELCKMRHEGLIVFEKNHFQLLHREEQ